MLPVLACFLGGATAKWAEGIVVALLGIYVLLYPPTRSLGFGLNALLLASVGCALVAFLPGNWFFEPEWRLILTNDFGIKLPNRVSPQPWVTAQCVASFLAALIWLYLVCAQDLELRDVRFQLRAFAVGIIILAACAIGFHAIHWAAPFWINERGFGPFPNRNQTANIFGIASVIVAAAAQDDAQHRRKRWIFWTLGYVVIVAAVVLNFSRAGIVIVIAAGALWVVTLSFRRGSASWIAISVALFLIVVAALLIFGGQTLERFHLRAMAGGTGVAADFRWLIFRDTWQLIKASPWCGLGFGNFEAAFAIFRNASIANERALHPESDWLWLWSELGWPAVLLVIAGLGLLARFVLPLSAGSNQRLRFAALIAVVACVVHGFVDVSAHRVGTAYSAIFLLGLSLHRPLRFRSSSVTPWIFRVLAITLVAAGAAWTFSTQRGALLPGSIGAANARQSAAAATHGRDYDRAVTLVSTALAWSPLDWRLYFARALAEYGKGLTEDALDDFRRARFLEPNAYELPFEEGKVWLATKPTLAVAAWRETLRRAGPHRAEIFDSMLSLSTMMNRAVVPKISELSLNYHELILVNLRRASGPSFNGILEQVRERDSALKNLNEGERKELFELWRTRGDTAALEESVAADSTLATSAWPALAKIRADAGDYKSAVDLFREHHGVVALPRLASSTDTTELERTVATDPRNYAAGFELYEQQRTKGDLAGALSTVRHFTSLPGSPGYFNYLEGEAWFVQRDDERAWKAYSRLLEMRTER